jgi:hypothetical protein
VINMRGWLCVQGIMGMRVGGRRKLTIPLELGIYMFSKSSKPLELGIHMFSKSTPSQADYTPGLGIYMFYRKKYSPQ